ncbi:unnamed protein product, partial [Leptidea sinapis]
ILAILRFFELLQVPDFSNQLWGLIWIIISILIVTFFQIKTISRYILRNEKIECNHLPLMNLNKLDKLSENSSSLASLQKIYDASENKKKTSSVLGSTLHINN